MAKKNNSIMDGAGIALMAILVYLFTSKKFLIALGILIVFVIIYAIIKSRKQNQQSENGISTSDSEMPGNVAYFSMTTLQKLRVVIRIHEEYA